MLKLSIIVPMYNVENYIEKCLDSLVNQSLLEIEILIIDDGSLDSSIEIAKDYQKKYEFITIYYKPNGGLSDARNFAIPLAKGEYISFIDSDDYIDSKMMEKMYLRAKENDSDIVCCDMYYVEDDVLKYSYGADFDISSYNINPSIISINNSACNKIYRREFMKNKIFPKGMWYEDLAVIPIWLALANNVSHVNEALYYYIQRKGSIAHTINPKIFDIYKAINNVKLFLEENNYIGFEESINTMYIKNCLVMTTLRIKDYDNKYAIIKLLKENIDYLCKYYPKWYKNKKIKEYNYKQRLVFFLLKNKMFHIVVILFR